MSRTACLNSIYELAKKDERVVFIGSDLAPNTLPNFKQDFPDRYFMEGVQEQNIIGMASGLAMEGFIPYVNTIATFLTRRCYEQIVIDICAHNLPVRLIGNGGGLVYAPLGLTHCAIDDIAIMRAIPNMSAVCCSDSEEMKEFMPQTLDYPGPVYIRLGKDSDPCLKRYFPFSMDEISNYPSQGKSKGIVIFSTGIMTDKALTVAEIIGGINVKHLPVIKPFPSLIMPYGTKMIVTMEEGIINGGLGSAILECFADHNIHIPILRFGLPDAFPHHYGEQSDLLETYGLTPEKMAIRIKEFYDNL